MPKSRDSYRVASGTPAGLNFLLQRIADRLDRMEGIRGTASIESDLDMNLNVIADVGAGSSTTDAARHADLAKSPV